MEQALVGLKGDIHTLHHLMLLPGCYSTTECTTKGCDLGTVTIDGWSKVTIHFGYLTAYSSGEVLYWFLGCHYYNQEGG